MVDNRTRRITVQYLSVMSMVYMMYKYLYGHSGQDGTGGGGDVGVIICTVVYMYLQGSCYGDLSLSGHSDLVKVTVTRQ